MSARRIWLLALALLLVGASYGVATAHNGAGAVVKTTAGPYRIWVYDPEAVAGGRAEYRVVTVRRTAQVPAYDVTFRAVGIDAAGRRSTGQVQTFGNVHYVSFVNPFPHGMRVQLQVSGPLGKGATRFRVHGVRPLEDRREVPAPAESDGWPAWATAVLVVAGASLLGLGAGLRLRRKKEPAGV